MERSRNATPGREPTFSSVNLAVTLALALLLGSSTPALGEGFISGRFGGSFTDDGKVDPGGDLADALDLDDADARYEDSITFGLRGGYWIDPFDYLGFALDLSYFRADLDKVKGFDVGNNFDVYVVPMSLLVMGRLPLLRDDSHPHGLLQPYVGIGPSVFLTVADAEIPDFDNYAAVGADVGLDFVSGVNVQITELIALFLEYRYTDYKAKLNDDLDVVKDVKLDLDLETHHITAGIGFHF
jgi:opacity protein-like surface antigen